MQQDQSEYIDQMRLWHSSMQNLFITNRIEHIESKESVDSIISNKKEIFFIFVRVFYDENTTSHETHLEQSARRDSALSKIEDRNIHKKVASHWVMRRANNLFNEHAIDLMTLQYVTNMQWVRNWARNHFIILSTLYRKMINKYWESTWTNVWETISSNLSFLSSLSSKHMIETSI